MQVHKSGQLCVVLEIRTESQGELFQQETERRPTAVSVSVVTLVQRSLFTVFLCELLGILHEFPLVFSVFLCQVSPQRVLGLGDAHQSNEIIDHWRREGMGTHVSKRCVKGVYAPFEKNCRLSFLCELFHRLNLQ